jgi:hypothetical protein
MALLFPFQVHAQTTAPVVPTEVHEIEITSTWSRGLVGGTHSVYLLIQHGWDGYHQLLLIARPGTPDYQEHGTVNAGLVMALINAFRAPASSKPTLKGLGVTPAWLKANAYSAVRNVSRTASMRPGIPEATLASALAHPARMDATIQTLFRRAGVHGEFWPSAEIRVYMEDGTRWVAASRSQFPYMLPWQLTLNGKRVIAYNAGISRAVVALMPEESAIRPLLASENFDRMLTKIAMQQIRRQYELRDIENKPR